MGFADSGRMRLVVPGGRAQTVKKYKEAPSTQAGTWWGNGFRGTNRIGRIMRTDPGLLPRPSHPINIAAPIIPPRNVDSWATRVGCAFCCGSGCCSDATVTGHGSPARHVSGHVFRTSHGRAEQARHADAALRARATGRAALVRARPAPRTAWSLHPRGPAAVPVALGRTAFLFRGPWRGHPARAVHPSPALARGLPAAQQAAGVGRPAGRTALEILALSGNPED